MKIIYTINNMIALQFMNGKNFMIHIMLTKNSGYLYHQPPNVNVANTLQSTLPALKLYNWDYFKNWNHLFIFQILNIKWDSANIY